MANETKLAEEEGAKVQDRKCPRCGKDVGWDSLPMDTELLSLWFPLPFKLKNTPIVKGKRCPSCEHPG